MRARGSVYLEITVISCLVARPSRDLRVAAHQQVTSEWWLQKRADFDLPVSQLVIEEASAGDEAAASRRLESVAAVHGMDYQLTWNCKHIANATMRQRVETACSESGYDSPIICTPEELLEE